MDWKIWIIQTTQKWVREMSNNLVGNIYWMVVFKINVFDASLFEETPNRSSLEICQSFLSLMFSLQYIEGCPRVSFYLNNLDNEVGNEW